MLFCFSFDPPSLSSCSIYSACEEIFKGKYYCPPPLPYPPPSSVFNPSCHFCRGQFPVMYSFPLRVYERHGACLCPEMVGSSVMWWVYIFKKITPIVRIMSIIVILNFCCWWWWLYIFFSSAVHCYETILFYCRISFLWICCLCSTCCTETFQRKQEIPIPPPLLFSF